MPPARRPKRQAPPRIRALLSTSGPSVLLRVREVQDANPKTRVSRLADPNRPCQTPASLLARHSEYSRTRLLTNPLIKARVPAILKLLPQFRSSPEAAINPQDRLHWPIAKDRPSPHHPSYSAGSKPRNRPSDPTPNPAAPRRTPSATRRNRRFRPEWRHPSGLRPPSSIELLEFRLGASGQLPLRGNRKRRAA